MIEERADVAAHIAAVMSAELGFSPDDSGKTMTAVQLGSAAALGRLWILKLEGFGWKVIDLRGRPNAAEFDPDAYLAAGPAGVSHRNIGA